MTSSIRALAGFARCERPTSEPPSELSDQPGRLQQGPDEKKGRIGFVAGFIVKRCEKLGLCFTMSRVCFVKLALLRVPIGENNCCDSSQTSRIHLEMD